MTGRRLQGCASGSANLYSAAFSTRPQSSRLLLSLPIVSFIFEKVSVVSLNYALADIPYSKHNHVPKLCME
jgi:hypothetical protein